jgi:hypothetical protein
MRAVIECQMDSAFSHCYNLMEEEANVPSMAAVRSGSAAEYFRQIVLLHCCCHARKELRNALKK